LVTPHSFHSKVISHFAIISLARLRRNFFVAALLILIAGRFASLGTTVPVPNASFELPAPNPLFPISTLIDSWQKTPEPDWYSTNGSIYTWDQLCGIFGNTAPGSADHIGNMDGDCASWMFAVPEVGYFQDYDSVDWNDVTPSHAFDAIYEPGKSYQMTVGLFGGGAGRNGGMLLGATLQLSLYYRDANSNRVTVAAITITNSAELFTSNTNFVDFTITVPTVKPGDAWAGQHIGIFCLSTVPAELQGGYWDLDNVRLVSILAPQLVNPTLTNNQFQFRLHSEPGLRFDILASTNATLPLTSWTVLGTVTNVTGELPFVDSAPNFPHRFYQARQLP
jgi:hypothetical protein